MKKCLVCGENMYWKYSKGWRCPNGCVLKTTISNHTELVEFPVSTTTTISIVKEEVGSIAQKNNREKEVIK